MDLNSSYELTIKLLIVGDSTVGKTNFIKKYVENKFNESYFASTGIDLITTSIKIEGKSFKIQIWDTAGQEKYRAMTKNLFLKTQGIVIIFDISNETSFINLKSWMNDIKEECSADIPMILVGNKLDLEDKRVIDKERAMEFAKNKKLEYIETSSKTGENINKSLSLIIEKIYQRADSNSNFSFTLDDGTVKKKSKKICC